jgi:hypothetical protein
MSVSPLRSTLKVLLESHRAVSAELYGAELAEYLWIRSARSGLRDERVDRYEANEIDFDTTIAPFTLDGDGV